MPDRSEQHGVAPPARRLKKRHVAGIASLLSIAAMWVADLSPLCPLLPGGRAQLVCMLVTGAARVFPAASVDGSPPLGVVSLDGGAL